MTLCPSNKIEKFKGILTRYKQNKTKKKELYPRFLCKIRIVKITDKYFLTIFDDGRHAEELV